MGDLQWIAYDLLFKFAKPELIEELIPLFPLDSSVGIDYSQLRTLLFAGKWANANDLTTAKILEAVGHLDRKYVDLDDLQYLPVLDLRTIDRLWIKASDRRFGFSIQRQIYLQANGSFEYRGASEFGKEFSQFCHQLGWAKEGWHKTDPAQAPIGFMPHISRETRGGAYYTIGLLSHPGLSIEDVSS
jgi:hypothetical protein